MDALRNDEVATKRDVNQLKQELIERIDANGINIEANAKKIEVNGEKIEDNREAIIANGEKIDSNHEAIVDNSRKIETNGEKIGRLITEVVKNHDAIEKTLTREEYKRDYNHLLQGQDKMMVILLRLDQERVITNERLDRLEAGRN